MHSDPEEDNRGAAGGGGGRRRVRAGGRRPWQGRSPDPHFGAGTSQSYEHGLSEHVTFMESAAAAAWIVARASPGLRALSRVEVERLRAAVWEIHLALGCTNGF